MLAEILNFQGAKPILSMGSLSKVVEKKAEIISRITDYKKSLIYEVVTGKKEV